MTIILVKLLLIGLMLLGSSIFIIIGINILLRTKYLKKYGIKTDATIVEVTLQGRPTVEYQTKRGLIKIKSLYGSTVRCFRKGNIVQVRYDRAKPERFLIEEDKIPVVLSFVFLLIGVIVLGMALLIYLLL